MAELVRDHIRLREVALGSELRLQLIHEAEVDVYLLVRRTVKRTGRRLRHAATRLCEIAKEHELRIVIPRAHRRQELWPDVLHVVEHEGDEFDFLVLFRRFRDGTNITA